MKNYFNICNLYILFWCIYYLQGTLYASGSIISQMLLLMLMVISGYYFVIANARYDTPLFIKVLNIFIGVLTIYGIILMLDPTPIYVGFTLSKELSKIEFLKSIYRYIQIGVYIRGYQDRVTKKFIREIAEVTEFYVDDNNVPKYRIIYQ